MTLEMFAILDNATGLFSTPMFMASKGQAIRSLTDEVNRAAADNQLYNHAEDFHLYALGTWDNNTAQFTQDKLELIVKAQELKA